MGRKWLHQDGQKQEQPLRYRLFSFLPTSLIAIDEFPRSPKIKLFSSQLAIKTARL